MPASKEKLDSSALSVKTLGVIAGGGALPLKLLHACDDLGIEPFIVAFDGQTDPALVQGYEHMWTRFGAIGKIIKTLKSHDVRDLVMIGKMRRPSMAELKPDLKAAELIAKLGFGALGDNDFLGVIRKFLEAEGFEIHGVHKFATDLLAPSGVIGKHKPGKADWADINRGLEVSLGMGHLDVGQSVIVQEGIVLGVEAIEGTDALMKRCGDLMRGGRKAVLVKTCKPQQDRDFDLPTIGPETIENAAHSGLGGVVIHAGHSLVYDLDGVVQTANKHKLYVVGVDPSEDQV